MKVTHDEVVEAAVRWCADTHGEFTTDQVWFRLEDQAYVWPEDRSRKDIAQVMLRLQRAGVIEKTTRQRPSDRRERHGAPVALWVAAGMAWAQVDAVPVPKWLSDALRAEAAERGMDLMTLVAKKLQT